MFQFNGKEYELHYNMNRCERVEAMINKPIMAMLVSTNGALGLKDLKALFALGLRKVEENEVGGHSYIDYQEGIKYAETLIEEKDYAFVLGAVLEALQKDCPFFFPADSTS